MLALVGLALLVAAPSCKKGANDPGLSLKSRKARLAGEYKVSNWSHKETDNYGGTISTITVAYDGGASATVTYDADVTTMPIALFEYTFKKDGTWEKNFNYTSTNVYSTSSIKVTETITHTTVSTGNWAFVGKTKGNYKNKERVQLSILSETDNYNKSTVTKNLISGTTSAPTTESGTDKSTYDALEYVMIYTIDMLKNKEMVFKYMENNVDTSTDSSGTTTGSYTVDETITLTQK